MYGGGRVCGGGGGVRATMSINHDHDYFVWNSGTAVIATHNYSLIFCPGKSRKTTKAC